MNEKINVLMNNNIYFDIDKYIKTCINFCLGVLYNAW